MSVARFALLAQIATTLPLVGLIWTVQLLVYPQLANVGVAEFAAYHAEHARRISWAVGPLMGIELVAAATNVLRVDSLLPRGWAIIGLGLVFLAWGVTGLVSVPLHSVLAGGFSARAHRLLVGTNWLRTVAWTARGVLLLGALRRGLPR